MGFGLHGFSQHKISKYARPFKIWVLVCLVCLVWKNRAGLLPSEQFCSSREALFLLLKPTRSQIITQISTHLTAGNVLAGTVVLHSKRPSDQGKINVDCCCIFIAMFFRHASVSSTYPCPSIRPLVCW